MVQIHAVYEGALRCLVTHGPSGCTLQTDAPVDNHGRGEAFSPTDLVATALGTCMMTVMGIVAERHGIDLGGMRADVTKEMTATPPRRIRRLAVVLHMPSGLSPAQRQLLENAARSCPVHKSLHPDVEISITFSYPD